MPAAKTDSNRSQFALLAEKRFRPFFWTQFWGALNDNIFKNALMIVIVYQLGMDRSGHAAILTNAAAGLFILPFFLFSATAGQLADHCEKSGLIRKIKLAEILIMGMAAVGFYLNNIPLLMVLLFLMGTHSSFFGPVKYGILPQHLTAQELVGGNALVETGTFAAILLGTMVGGRLIQADNGRIWVGLAMVLVAVAGWRAGRGIPVAPPVVPDLKIRWNPLVQTLATLRRASGDRPVFLTILAISWFWFLGAVYLTQLPGYTHNVLNCGGSVVSLLLVMFALGVGAGSLLCEGLSGRKVELGLVPMGALGLSLFGLDLAWSGVTRADANQLGIAQFLQVGGSPRILCDLCLMGACGGVFTVPLYAFLQLRTPVECRAQMMAANNILNALFMVAAAVGSGILLGPCGFSIPQLFLTVAVVNLLVCAYIFKQLPEFAVRFLAGMLTHCMYRIREMDLCRIPEEGPAVIVANHISYMDALIIGGACRRPIRFVMHGPYFHLPVLKNFFRAVGAIPIVSKRTDPAMYQQAFDAIATALQNGELVCIFPEGGLTRDGRIDVFRPGIEKIIQRNPVPVIPLALRGMWGSFFSRKYGRALLHVPRRFWSRIELKAGVPLRPHEVSASRLQACVQNLRGAWL